MDISIPATSANLGPGFDSLGLALNLYNHVSISESKFLTISVNGESEEQTSACKHNLFVVIFSDIFKRLTHSNPVFKFKFQNNIPFSRGLGSSSAVIVGAIAAAYEMAGFKPEREVVLNEALFYENHPDNISPATYGGFTANVIENNKVITQRCEISDEICAVVTIPDQPMNTQQSRTALPKSLAIKDAVVNLSHSAFITACFFSKDYKALIYGARDKIHEDIRMNNLPELFKIRKIGNENGAILSTLSGSGSSFLNIVYRDDAKKLKQILSEKFSKFQTEIFKFDNGGFKIEK